MAYRKRRSFRGKKRSFRRRSSRRGRRSYNDSLIKTKLRQVQTLASNGSGYITGYVTPQNASSATNWAAYAGMYDQYRVSGIKLTYHPTTTEAALSGVATYPYGSIYMVYDTDTLGSTTAALSIATLIGYNNVKILPMGRKWSVYYRCPRPNQTTLATPAGWLNTAATAPTLGAVGYNSEQTIPSTNMAHMVITYYLHFKGKI